MRARFLIKMTAGSTKFNERSGLVNLMCEQVIGQKIVKKTAKNSHNFYFTIIFLTFSMTYTLILMYSIYTNFQEFFGVKAGKKIIFENRSFTEIGKSLKYIYEEKNSTSKKGLKPQKFPITGSCVLNIYIYLRFFRRKKNFGYFPKYVHVLT